MHTCEIKSISFFALCSIHFQQIMTKKEAIAMFNDEWEHYVKFRAPEYASDTCAKRQGFVDFIDTLHRDGEISDRQVNSWENPF